MLLGAFQPSGPSRFTATYGCKRLLYFEDFEEICTGIAREKQAKACTDLGMEDECSGCIRDHPVRIAGDPGVGLRWLKSSKQHG
jgi:hypothetical protein